MRVLITGATGFVGSHLAKALTEQGYQVRALARPSSETAALENIGVQIFRGDVTDASSVERAGRDCQQVYHLAAKMPMPGLGKKDYFLANVEGTHNLVRAALKLKVTRLVHASSAGVYGVIRKPPVTENSRQNPTSGYRESKAAAEELVMSYHRKEGLPVVRIRLPGVYGPGSTNLLGLARVIGAGGFRLIGSGENHDHMGYVTDVVDALRRCAETKGIEGECYLIAGRDPVKVRDLVAMIAEELGMAAPTGRLPVGPFRVFNTLGETVYKCFGFDLPGVYRYTLFVADKILDISKAQRELGYNPQVSMREGIRRTIEWYRQQGYFNGARKK